MVPDADLQLSVVIKALREVVAPAVDPANTLAIEQLHLSIATIGLVQRGLPLAHARARRELINALALARAVVDAGGAVAGISDAQAALGDVRLGEADLDAVRKALLSSSEAAVAASVGTDTETAVARAVIAASKAQFDLARAWGEPAGFEVERVALPSLESVLAQ